MKKQAEVIDLRQKNEADEHAPKSEIQFDSGHQVRVHDRADKELIEVREPDGDVVVTIRMTQDGPVISAKGAKLELKSTQRIALDAKTIEIRAEEKAVVESDGGLEIGSSKQMEIHSEDDVRVNGKTIHLN